MAELFLLSGLPGVGKTTSVRELVSSSSGRIARIHFGEFLRRAVENRLDKSLDPAEFRAVFSDLLVREDFDAASEAVRDEVDRSDARVCVLDTHAVTPSSSGLRVTPDNARRMDLLAVSGLAHISCLDAVDRVVENGGRDGRRSMSPSEVAVAEAIQLSVMVGYSSYYDCPLMVVSGGGNKDQVTKRVGEAVESILGSSG